MDTCHQVLAIASCVQASDAHLTHSDLLEIRVTCQSKKILDASQVNFMNMTA